MIINSTSYQNNTYTNLARINKNSKTGFRGVLANENLKKGITNGTREYLIQETAFFRNPETLEFVKEYITKELQNKSKINIIDGACSCGYETYSIAMLLDDLGKKCNILGFDIGKKAINKAKKGVFKISKINNNFFDILINTLVSVNKDSYLAFSPITKLSSKELKYKKLFNKYYKEIPNPNKTSANKTLKDYFSIKSTTSKLFKIKKEKSNICRFVEGDILKLDKIVSPKSADVLFFRNALYHLTTKEGKFSIKIPLPEKLLTPIIQKVVKQVDKAIAPKGLFVIGEHTSDHYDIIGDILYKELKKHNFTPAYTNSLGDKVIVWKKIT